MKERSEIERLTAIIDTIDSIDPRQTSPVMQNARQSAADTIVALSGLGPLRPAGTADLHGVPRAEE